MLKTTEQSKLNGRVEMLECFNPATGASLGSVPMATADSVRHARQEMRVASRIWARKPLRERVRILRQFQAVLIESLDEITSIINKDTGKSRQDALIEVFITTNMLAHTLRHASRWLKRQIKLPGLYVTKFAYIDQRPFGTVAVISPWNYPFLLALQPVLMALIAGNTVILKPSEMTAVTGQLIERLFRKVPELAPYVRVLHGDGRVGAALVESKPDLIYLTGSTRTGQLIAQAAAEDLIPCIFELGGKDPMIVLPDADVAAAAEWGAWASCMNAGQTCVSIERIYVTEPVYDQFVERLIENVQNLNVGYSAEVNDPHHFGPLSSERQAEIVEAHIADAVAKGAEIATGGTRDGLFMQPTVLLNIDHSMKVMQEETFGPLLPVMQVRDAAEAVELANQSEFGLGASVWGKISQARAVLEQLDSGTLVANDAITQFAVPSIPFGGVKKSGNGRAHGKEDLLQFTQSRSYLLGPAPIPADISVKLRQPGNYRLGEAVLKLVFGVGLRQKLQPISAFLHGRRVRQLRDRLNELIARVTSSN